MFEIKNLTCRYENATVLEDFSTRLEEGSLCALMGRNGAGKTTLLRCCMNLMKQMSGEITLGGVDLHGLNVVEASKLVAYVPQEHSAAFPFSVKDVVLMGRTPHLSSGISVAQKHYDRVEEALSLVGISELAGRPYTNISGGQRQLALLARAWVQDTKLILLDEPTASLDIDNQLKIWSILQQMAAEGKVLLVSTHHPEHALWYCDQVVVLDKKKKLADGHPKKVLNQDILNQLFRNSCYLVKINGAGTIVPRSLSFAGLNDKKAGDS